MWSRSARGIRSHGAAALGLVAVLAAGCAGRAAAPALPGAPPAGGAALARELDAIIEAPAVNALWGVLVESFDTGEILYERNADLLMVPASNMKIITMAAAAERLGWDHRFETRLEAHGTLADGTLDGHLVVVGGGDPALGGPLDDARPVFEAWASALRDAGIRRVTGCLIGDDSAFRGDPFGAGWSWSGLTYGYSAPVSALSFHENVVQVTVRPGAEAGQPAVVALEPSSGGLTLAPQVVTAARNSEPRIEIRRDPGDTFLAVRGSLPAGGEAISRTVAVPDPSWFFASELDRVLAEQDIAVDGGPAAATALARAAERAPAQGGDAGACAPAPDEAPRTVVATHRSKPLRDIGERFMKVSQNLYGELLVGAIGASRAADAPEAETLQAGREAIDDQLARWGVAPDAVRLADGSGLSRLNFVSPRALMRVLRRMWLDDDREPFFATFPIAGEDGTLRSRFRGTRAAGAAHAKTGTLTSVRALSGYVTSADGETIGFSMLANNFIVPTASVDAIVDRAVERLAHFRRAAQ